MEHLGQHLIIEFWGCNEFINDASKMRTAMLEAVQAAQATLLDLHIHTFSPQGVTGVAVLTESHLSVHTWPEYGYLAADVFTCGKTTRPLAAAEVLKRHFQPTQEEVRLIYRGIFSDRSSHEKSKVRPKDKTKVRPEVEPKKTHALTPSIKRAVQSAAVESSL